MTENEHIVRNKIFIKKLRFRSFHTFCFQRFLTTRTVEFYWCLFLLVFTPFCEVLNFSTKAHCMTPHKLISKMFPYFFGFASHGVPNGFHVSRNYLMALFLPSFFNQVDIFILCNHNFHYVFGRLNRLLA